VRIDGAARSYFSLLQGNFPHYLFPRIRLFVQEPTRIETPAAKHDEQHYLAGQAMHRVMTDMMFAGRAEQTLFQSLLQAARIQGRSWRVVGDVEHVDYSYAEIIARSMLLGRELARRSKDGERIGILAGTETVANATAARFRERLADLQKRYSPRPAVRTFYQIWKEPLMTIGGKQIISDVVRLCGGENVFAQLETMAPTVTIEAVIATNPEAIVASGMNAARPEWLDDWKRWTSITAVARDNLFFVPPELIQRHTPRLLDGAERLCQHLETARGRRSGE